LGILPHELNAVDS
jgi:hypothetical protein